MPGTLATNPVVAAWFGLRWVAQGAARVCPPPPQVPPGGLGTALLHKRAVAGGPWDKLASAKRRQRPATTLPRSVAAARAQQSRASFGRQTEAFEALSLLRRSRSNPFLGGHSDGADRASKKATEHQLFFWASVKIASPVRCPLTIPIGLPNRNLFIPVQPS